MLIAPRIQLYWDNLTQEVNVYTDAPRNSQNSKLQDNESRTEK